MKKQIVIGCDNAAVRLKRDVIALLEKEGCLVENIGVDSEDDATYYPAVARSVCEQIIASGYQKQGVLLCGTGLGMAMTANKFPGIFAGVAHDVYSTERLCLSNNANVLCMGARVIGPELAKMLVKQWIHLEFVDGSSTPKVQLMHEIDTCTRK